MDIFLKQTIEGVGVYLRKEEALRLVRDPTYAEHVRSQVAAMLRGGGLDLETGEQRPGVLQGAVAGAFGVPALPAPGTEPDANFLATSRRGGAASVAARRLAPGDLPPTVCTVCGHEFSTPGRMKAHRTQKHDRPRKARGG